jgi:hypothetical protein
MTARGALGRPTMRRGSAGQARRRGGRGGVTRRACYPPDRWVIDLSAGDYRLLAPQLYHTIDHPEDRLHVPAEYVPLFERTGWKPTEAA